MKEQKPTASKRKRGRPVNYRTPDPIPDTFENVLKALVRSTPKKTKLDEWDCKKSAK